MKKGPAEVLLQSQWLGHVTSLQGLRGLKEKEALPKALSALNSVLAKVGLIVV